jgi:hypothetical protein
MSSFAEKIFAKAPVISVNVILTAPNLIENNMTIASDSSSERKTPRLLLNLTILADELL